MRRSEIDQELQEDMQYWVFQLEEKIAIKPRGVSFIARSAPDSDYGSDEVVLDPDEISWRSKAACRGADMAIFFPPKGASLLPAYSICIVCPVRLKCLESLLVEPFGVIAGFSERERKVIAKRVREGMSLEEAIKPEDARKARKLHSAALRDSPALYHKGTRISIEDLPIPQA